MYIQNYLLLNVCTKSNFCVCICIQCHLKCNSALIRRMVSRFARGGSVPPYFTKRHMCMTHQLGAGMTHRPTLQSCTCTSNVRVQNYDRENHSFFSSLSDMSLFMDSKHSLLPGNKAYD